MKHKITKVENYLLIVSDENINQGDYINCNNEVEEANDEWNTVN